MSAAVAELLLGLGLASLCVAARPTQAAMPDEVAAWTLEAAREREPPALRPRHPSGRGLGSAT